MEHVPVQNRKAISLFLTITFGLSLIFYFLIIYTGKISGGSGRYVTGLMWCPGISAILTSIILKRKVSLLGWKWGETRYQIWSYLIPLLYALLAYLIIWLGGFGKFYNPNFVEKFSLAFGFEKLPNEMAIVLYCILMGIFGMPASMASALGEEIGWRGFLVPELYKTMSYTKTSVITGIIWAVWHYPILIFADYNSGTPAWYGLSCFTVMVVSISFVFTWFRLRSQSLWTAVILHASHNLIIQTILTPLTQDTGATKFYIDEFGVVLPVVCLGIAIYFWTKRSDLVLSNDRTEGV